MKKVKFKVEITYVSDIPNDAICELSMKEHLEELLKAAAKKGELTPSGVSVGAVATNISIVSEEQDHNASIKYPMTNYQFDKANEEGWILAENEACQIQIQRSAEVAIFKNDTEAWQYIIKEAMSGSEFHLAVINGIKEQNRKEYEAMINSGAHVKECDIGGSLSEYHKRLLFPV